jgi:leucyl aminopeptidase (aminopeptidase T)
MLSPIHHNSSREGAKTILSVCAGVRKNDRLLIAFDSSGEAEAQVIDSMAREIGAIVKCEKILEDLTREPPETVAEAMLENDVTIFSVDEKSTSMWGHADAKSVACQRGHRVLFLTQRLEETPPPLDLYEISKQSARLGDILERVKEVRLVTGNGSELKLKLGGRKALRLSSILTRSGSWGAIPDYGEAGIAPLETESNGVFSADSMIVGFGKVDQPVELEFRNGNLTRIGGGRTASDFERYVGQYGDSARVLCEIGFGTNHLRHEVRGEFDDKKILGAVHIALGDNHTFGGANRADLHVDCMALSPAVYFDNQKFDFAELRQ